MNIFTKSLIIYCLVVLFGIIYATKQYYENITPSARQASEEVMVNTANLLATMFTPYLSNNLKNLDALEKIVKDYKSRDKSSPDWSSLATKNELDFYVTDRQGIVLAHSSNSSEIGKDYSRWNDVRRTLAGHYGARTTRLDPSRDDTAVMYVSAPIYYEKQIIGVVSVIQDHQGLKPYISKAQRNVIITATIVTISLIIFGLSFAGFSHSSIRKLTNYVNSVRQGKNVNPIVFKDKVFNELATSTHELRKELDGKSYIEDYIHTLTHELKTPLAAISSASQILKQDISPENKSKFLNNIECESERMRKLVDRVLLLAQVENTDFESVQKLDLNSIISDEIESFAGLLALYDLTIEYRTDKKSFFIQGDKFLLSLAIRNLLANAIEFAMENTAITITTLKQVDKVELAIENIGAAIPDYALSRLFERFFSTPRDRTGRKSSGLGLCLTKEICDLHHAILNIENTGNGVQAKVSFHSNTKES